MYPNRYSSRNPNDSGQFKLVPTSADFSAGIFVRILDYRLKGKESFPVPHNNTLWWFVDHIHLFLPP